MFVKEENKIALPKVEKFSAPYETTVAPFWSLIYELTSVAGANTQRANVEAQDIAAIIESIGITDNLDKVLMLIHRLIKKLLYAENCFVELYDEPTKLVHYEFWVDKFDPAPSPRPASYGFGSYVLRTGKPLLLTDEIEEALFRSGKLDEMSGSKSTSWMGVPLVTPTGIIGVLVVQHYDVQNVYNHCELEILSSVGDQIVLEIERKRAEDELKVSETKLRRLAER